MAFDYYRDYELAICSIVANYGSDDEDSDTFLALETHDAKKASPNNGYSSKVHVLDRYKVVGFISSGTYGRVYKAIGVNGQVGEFAIKKFVDLLV